MEPQNRNTQPQSQSKQSLNKPQSKAQEPKIHKGIYINNQRRKGRGGRIKSNSIDLKIEINQKPSALHQSQVEWIQIRRYIKGQKRQEPKLSHQSKQSYKPKQQGQKQLKYQAKQSSSNHENKKKDFKAKYAQKQQKNNLETNQPKQKQSTQQPQQKKFKKKYKLKKQEFKTQQQKIEEKLSELKLQNQNNHLKQQIQVANELIEEKENIKKQNQEAGLETTGEQHKIKQQIQQKKTRNEQADAEDIQKKQTKQQQAGSGQQQQKQKEVVVAKIVKQLKNIFKQKQFVGLFYAQQKSKNNQKYRNKYENQSLLNDFFQRYILKVYPLHSRLEVMEIQDSPQIRQKIQTLLKREKLDINKIKLDKILKCLEENYVLLKFNKWVKNIPTADLIKFVGKINTIDGQCSAFLHQYGLNDFDHQQQDDQPLQITPTQFHIPCNRMIFTIDPKTSMDLDDALSIQPTEDPEVFQIGIHISDVSTYLHKINRDQLIRRSTSVYLPHRVYHMLPRPLMNVCSLNPQVQRLAFSVFVKINLKGKIVGQSRLQKNIIKSRYKLDYDTAQDILTKKTNYEQFNKKRPSTVQEYISLTQKLQKLCQIGLVHRKQRILFDVFENKQVEFALDQENWPIDVTLSKRYTAKKIVQQFMIIGNVEAAKHLVKINANNALVIHHPPPSQLTITYFNEYFKQLGINIKFKNSRQTQMQLLQIQKRQDLDQAIKKVCFFKARRCQQKANYKIYSDIFDEDETKLKQQSMLQIERTIHFALDQEYYTHFTSPMRRMADILVHEALNTIVLKKQANKIPQNQLQRINFGRTATTRLKRDIVDLYICLLIKRTSKQFELDGVVVSFGLQSISIFIPMFDNIKQIMWRRQLNISRIQKLQKKKQQQKKTDIAENKNTKQKQKTEEQELRVWLYYDKKDQRKDVYWNVKKFDKVKMLIDSTNDAPYRMKITLSVMTNKGEKKIFPHKDFD